MDAEILSIRIKNAREKMQITKAEAARRLNLSKIGYCRYEYGERIPSVQTLEVIARCFNTSVDYLIGQTDDISPDSVTVSRRDTPLLFELITTLKNSNSETMKRMLKYYNELLRENMN